MTKIINRILAAALLIAIFAIGGVTLTQNFRSIGYAALVRYTQFVKDKGLSADLKARIEAVESTVNTKILGKDAFQKLNARVQLMLGKQMLSFGPTTMVRLRTGQLYDVQADIPQKELQKEIDAMAKLNEKLAAQGVPMVFVYAHSELYEDGLLPTGVKDYNSKVADAIVSGMRAGGVETIDSRDIYRENGMTMDEAALRTDQHWSNRMAFEAYAAAVRALNATGAVALDESAANIGNFDVQILPGAHMGDVGARVGEASVAPDDFYLITPKFDTHIKSRVKRASNKWQEREGTFEQAVLNLDILTGDRAHNIYDTYGYHTDLAYYTNENATGGRILIIKDSFGTPTASFMSLAAREICTMDLRRTRLTPEQMVEEFKPDAVLVVHSQGMMSGKNYVFVD